MSKSSAGMVVVPLKLVLGPAYESGCGTWHLVGPALAIAELALWEGAGFRGFPGKPAAFQLQATFK